MRVATYNLYLGADLSMLFGVPAEGLDAAVATLLGQLEVTDFPTRALTIARLLADNQVDVVGLQEVTVWTRDGEVICDFLEELMGALGQTYDVHAVNVNFKGAGSGLTVTGSNVTLVKRGIAVHDEVTGVFAAVLTVPTPLGEVEILRSWGWVDLDGLRFVNTHTEAYDERLRDSQRDELLGLLQDTDRPVVLVGDFNATPDRVGVPTPYVDAWAAKGGANGATCGQAADLRNRTSTLTQRIDYIWVRDLEVDSCRLIGLTDKERTPTGLWPSDHAGVVAEVSLRSR